MHTKSCAAVASALQPSSPCNQPCNLARPATSKGDISHLCCKKIMHIYKLCVLPSPCNKVISLRQLQAWHRPAGPAAANASTGTIVRLHLSTAPNSHCLTSAPSLKQSVLDCRVQQEQASSALSHAATLHPWQDDFTYSQ